MNISGSKYSAATVGLRQPSKITDQQFKLVFIYPMIFDKSVSKISPQMRDFLSNTMLKEIFISNSINMVNLANQIHSVVDNLNATSTGSQTPSGVFVVSGSGGNISTPQSTAEFNKMEIQRQIQEKTRIIKHWLDTDPQLSKLNAKMKMITLDNLMEVPVIVGTKFSQVDSFSLAFMLMVSIVNNLPLTKMENIKRIVNIIKSMKPGEAHTVLNGVVQTQPTTVRSRFLSWIIDDVIGRFGGRLVSRKASSGYGKFRTTKAGDKFHGGVQKVGRGFKKTTAAAKKVNEYLSANEALSEDETFYILKTAKRDIDQLELFFKFCLDEKLLKSQYGLDVSRGQSSFIFNKTSSQLQGIYDEMQTRFLRLIGSYANPVVTSITNIMYPMGSNINVLKIRENWINELSNEIHKFITDSVDGLLNDAFNSKSQSNSKVLDNLKRLTNLCTGELKDSDDLFKQIANKLIRSNTIISNPNTLDEDNITDFVSAFDEVSYEAAAQSTRIEAALSKVFGGGLNPVLKNLFQTISAVNNDSFIKMITDNWINPSTENSNVALDIKFGNASIKVMDEMSDALNNYMYFIFMYSFQVALCKYVNIIELELDTAKNDAIEFPNYTLVVPIESIMAIAVGFASKTWKELVNRMHNNLSVSDMDVRFVKQVNENYINGIIKYLNNRLMIPNLVVVDSKKNTIYYKLMHQSSVQKLNLSSLQTYSKLSDF